MDEKNLVLVIEANQPYIRKIDALEKDQSVSENSQADFSAQNDILFSAITNTYVPLLNMLSSLEEKNMKFKIGLVLTAPLVSLLSDAQIQKQYIDHLDKVIALGENELKRAQKNQSETVDNILYNLENYKKIKTDFTEKYQQNLIPAFRSFQKKGYVELIASTATYVYLPHYKKFPEVINAQIETGLYSQRYYFGETGEGFYIPHMGWFKNLEKPLRSYGVNYSIVDARSFLFSESCPATGIFSPLRCDNSLVLFGNDPYTEIDINGDDGYLKNEVYRNQDKDIGFTIEQKYLSKFLSPDGKRIQTGYKYYNNESDESSYVLYDNSEADEQIKTDALDFYEKRFTRLDEASKSLKKQDVTLVCTIKAEYLGQKWHEGIKWLEELITIACTKNEINLRTCNELINDQFKLPKFAPYPCSNNGLGYGEDLLDNTNSFYTRYIQKATQRMIDLTERFPSESSLKQRLLNLGSKEVLLAQSSEWLLMLHDNVLNDYVENELKEKILNFSKVFDALASNTVSTEWLTMIEKNDAIFPWLNYRIFSKKK